MIARIAEGVEVEVVVGGDSCDAPDDVELWRNWRL